MNNNIKCAKLTLSHFPLITTQQNGVACTTAYGYTDAFFTNCTWTNIDMRDVLGDMYDEYDEFNLVLSNMINMSHVNWSVAIANFGDTANDETNYIEITGLDFQNQGYDQKTKTNAPKGVINGVYFPTNATAIPTIFNFSDNPMTFKKSYASSTTNINITFKKISDGGVPISDYNYRCVFNFNIYPVIESKKHI